MLFCIHWRRGTDAVLCPVRVLKSELYPVRVLKSVLYPVRVLKYRFRPITELQCDVI